LKIGGMSLDGTFGWEKINQNDRSDGNLSRRDLLFLISVLFAPLVGTPHLRRGLENASGRAES
jgi:hypothetical protein